MYSDTDTCTWLECFCFLLLSHHYIYLITVFAGFLQTTFCNQEQKCFFLKCIFIGSLTRKMLSIECYNARIQLKCCFCCYLFFFCDKPIQKSLVRKITELNFYGIKPKDWFLTDRYWYWADKLVLHLSALPGAIYTSL